MSTELTVTKIVHEGITPAPVEVDDAGNWFVNTGRCFLHILGGSVAGGIKITIESQAKCSFGHEHDIDITPVKDQIYLVGPFPKARFDDAAGKVQITPIAGAAADHMKAQVIELP